MNYIKLNQDIRDVLAIISNAREGRTINGELKPLTFDEVGLQVQTGLVYSAARNAHSQYQFWAGIGDRVFEIKNGDDERRARDEARAALALRDNALGWLYRVSHTVEAAGVEVLIDAGHMGVDGDTAIRGDYEYITAGVKSHPYAWAFNKLSQQGAVPLITEDDEPDTTHWTPERIKAFEETGYTVNTELLTHQGDLALMDTVKLFDSTARWVLIGWLKSIAEKGTLGPDWKRGDEMLKLALSHAALSISDAGGLFRFCIDAFSDPAKRAEFHHMYQTLLNQLEQIEFEEAAARAAATAKRELLYTQRATVVRNACTSLRDNGAAAHTLQNYIVAMASHLSAEESAALIAEFTAPAQAEAKPTTKPKAKAAAKPKAKAAK